MSVQDNLLNEKNIVLEQPESETEKNNQMCSFNSDEMEDMCYFRQDEARRECDTTTSEKYLKILDFRHFERFFQFSQSDRKGKKKAISDGVNVSVVLDMVSGNTSK